MRSVVVVLPASTWAMMPMLRSLSSILFRDRPVGPAHGTAVHATRGDNVSQRGGEPRYSLYYRPSMGLRALGYPGGLRRKPQAERRGNTGAKPGPHRRYGHAR